jgi:curved DNA-binding protein CbpA
VPFLPSLCYNGISPLLPSIAISMTENHYRTLGVAPTAGLDEIKQSYRQHIRRYHPDIFASRRSEILRMGDNLRLRAIEKEIEEAKHVTQRINAAYAILSDVDARAKYDRQLSEERQAKETARVYKQRMRASDDGRRTVKSRPHKQRTQAENAPWLVGLVFFVFLFIASAYITNGLLRPEQPSSGGSSRNQSSGREIAMSDYQATTNSRQATQVARATIAALPTLTPRSPEDNEQIGDNMMVLGQYHLAIESYSSAIRHVENTDLYVKRALAYSASFFSGVRSHEALARADFDQAILLDATNPAAYRGRGWLSYQLWLDNPSAETAQAAQADFESYLSYVETDDEIEAALLALNA